MSESDPPKDPSDSSANAIVEQMQNLKKQAQLRKHVDIPVATAIILLEVASSDHVIDKSEKSVIHNGLKSIFKISDQTAIAVVAKARTALANMRSSSTEASILKDVLDPASKQAIANLIDNLIRCNGVVDTMEVYLRQRFRTLLGLSDESLPPRKDN